MKKSELQNLIKTIISEEFSLDQSFNEARPVKSESTTYKLYLDDLRTPKTSGWVIVRSVEEAKNYINKNGMPKQMSLDHDLGDNVPTGYDFVKWLVYDKGYDLRDVDINIHSANPVGKDNMTGLINNWNEFKNSEIEETINNGDRVKYKRNVTAGEIDAYGVVLQIKGNKAEVDKDQGINPRKDWVELKKLRKV